MGTRGATPAVAALLVLLALCSTASSVPIKYLSVFGDSLLDTGNAWKVFDLPTPRSYQFSRKVQGRFSDSYNAVDYVQARLNGLRVRNNAWGGATACTAGFNEYIPNLDQQIDVFNLSAPADLLPARRATLVFLGHNDIYRQLLLVAQNQTTALAAFTYAVSNIPTCVISGVRRLLSRGEPNVIVFTLAPLDLAPFVATDSTVAAAVKQIITTVNNIITAQVATLAAANPTANLTLFDLNAAAVKYHGYATRQELGFKWASQRACLTDEGDVLDPYYKVLARCKNPHEYFFYQGPHPSARAHYLISGDIVKFMASKQLV